MSTILPIGKAHLLTISANMSDGSTNLTLPMTASTNEPTRLKVKINPGNGREVGVLALAGASGATVSATINGEKFVQVEFQVPVPTLASVTIAADSGEVTPPQWLIDP